MEIRHAAPADLPDLLALFDAARRFMAQNGNPHQWGRRFPTKEMLEADIEEKDKTEYDLKHELISAQIHLEEADKEIERLKDEINDLQKQIVKLETRAYQK